MYKRQGESVREGNVLIGWNKNNVPAWSWHIWSTSYDPEEDYVTYFVDRSSSKFYHVMLHSLGANGSAPEGSVGRYGLLYQWGRKDPFIGAKAVSGGEHAETYNAPGFEWKEEAVGVTTSLEFGEGIACLLYTSHSQGNVSEPGSVSTLDGYVYFTTAGTRGESAVSYPHLDVYKRQH